MAKKFFAGFKLIMRVNSNVNSNTNFYKSDNNRIQFKALHTGTVKSMIGDIPAEIELYKIERKDVGFLKSMYKNIKMKQLAPKYSLHKNFYDWQGVIRYAVEDISKGMEGILASVNKKPCALASIRRLENNNPFVSNFASWPILPEVTVKNAGKSVMRQLYQDVLKSGRQHITLTPLTDGPKDAISFYKSIGFDEYNMMTGEWRIRRDMIDAYADLMDDFLHYKESKEMTSYDLNKVMNIDYIPQKNKSFALNRRFLNFFKGFFSDLNI